MNLKSLAKKESGVVQEPLGPKVPVSTHLHMLHHYIKNDFMWHCEIRQIEATYIECVN